MSEPATRSQVERNFWTTFALILIVFGLLFYELAKIDSHINTIQPCAQVKP